MICSLSTKLDEKALGEIQSLEEKLGKTLLAFSCHELKPHKVSDDELSKIQSLENKLGISLVAVEG
jgi:hypothetical protein